MHVRAATSDDLHEVVAVHLRAFPDFTLTLLGARFLRLLYQGFLEQSDDAVLLVACDGVDGHESPGGPVVGFIAGAARPQGFFKRLRRRRALAFAIAAVPAVLSKPHRVLQRLLAGLRYRGDATPALDGYWLLSSLGVAPQVEGKGIGRELVSAFCRRARQSGAAGVYLLTDAQDNEAVRMFYTRAGFGIRSLISRTDGRQMILYATEFR